MSEQLIFIPQEFIKNLKSEKGWGWSRIKDHLTERNGGVNVLSKNKIIKLLDGSKDVSLTISELIKLSNIFEADKSFAARPIFIRNANLLDAFSSEPKISFLVGSQYWEKIGGEVVAAWDLRALRILFRSAEFSGKMKEIEHVTHYGDNIQAIKGSHWYQSINSREWNQSLISLGSPMSTHSSEYLLSKMFSVMPFRHPDPIEIQCPQRLPLYIYWPRKENRGVTQSAFLVTHKEFLKLVPKGQPQPTISQRAFILGTKVFISDRDTANYGIIATQRKSKGQVHMVFFGTYGPTTYGAAKLLMEEGIPNKLDEYNPKKPLGVMTTVYRVYIKPRESDSKNKSIQRDNRDYNGASLVGNSATAYWVKDQKTGWICDVDSPFSSDLPMRSK